MKQKDHFSQQAGIYATFRPTYPAALYKFLIANVTSATSAWDCATGNGQVARALARHFRTVYATDISQQQLDHAYRAPNIIYSRTAAEVTDFPSKHFDLITVAQALHWFNIAAFFKEVSRTGKPGGVIAVWGYSLPVITPEVDAVVRDFYSKKIGHYWDPARRLVEEAYQNITFPFKRLPSPEFRIDLRWNTDQLCGYLTSWSATQQYIRETNSDPVAEVRHKLIQLKGLKETFEVSFPIFMMAGKIET